MKGTHANTLAVPDFKDRNSHSPFERDLEISEETSVKASPNALHGSSPSVQRLEETWPCHRTTRKKIALLEAHTNCQDPKRANGSDDINSRRTFVGVGSNIVEIGRGHRDLTPTRHRATALLTPPRKQNIREKKPKPMGPHSSYRRRCHLMVERKGVKAAGGHDFW